ncbi:hypothetical protein GLOTRDRAFT_48389 [Gloeophyllum trabeum ATCC 11539]|uniref:DNA-directed DNA polymerase n=1 Tax=Gloeophyllum trabeum (strain ATCC 11539 / FP-39264 / Madison 617) TaxID=670483 RepID=S7PWH7_GLOTA|nr:uncharacterized protein GLOTRDRAFT_48389 [Gloeophyllum trabeum ATCC 11539]EPQ51697.1 hypothetical protein GLOTRDRAFT_48389 [Gloeophyllum trabeum ATCC 11539]
MTPDVAAPRNELGVQMLSRELHSQIFKNASFPAPDPAYVRIAREHLETHGLDPAQGSVLPGTAFPLPPLLGANLDQHFHAVGRRAGQPYLALARALAAAHLPPPPDAWDLQPGWTKYCHRPDGSSYCEPVPAPAHEGRPEEMLVFDVETMPRYGPHPVLACAASTNAWYAWISPWLLGRSSDPAHLIPLGDPAVPRVVVGHNVAYDRARVREEYALGGTGNRWLDTMALHVAVTGISSHQRPAWMKYRKSQAEARRLRDEAYEAVVDLVKHGNGGLEHLLMDEEGEGDAELEMSGKRWEDLTSANALADVAKLHCGIEMDKEVRNDFMTRTPEEILENVHDYLTYCANDVAVTHAVFSKVLPEFLARCPHPVSFAGILTMGSSFLTVNESWEEYIENAERKYKELEDKVKSRLVQLAQQAKTLADGERWKDDVWLSQLDWTPKIAGKSRGRVKKAPAPKPPPVFWPQWYWELTRPKKDLPPGTIDLSVRTRIAPLLLRLSWLGWPLFHSREHGWTFRVPRSADFPTRASELDFYHPDDETLKEMSEGGGFVFYKLPHKDGEKANVGSPLGKTFMKYAQDGTLKSPGDEAKDALDMNAQCSYWISARDRVMNQMVVWQDQELQMGIQDDRAPAAGEERPKKWGMILPQVVTMGTVTRRAMEKTWLTASNAKKNRVGSELKAMVRAPEGYSIVGADVDSEELWISSVMGDAQFGLHGATAIGWMTLEGTKAAGTDLHSKTASILGISRDQAKVFNYSRIYGAGMRHAVLLLMQANAGMLPEQAQALAEQLYAQTKGKNTHRQDLFGRKFWYGGTESFVFNKLEEIALSDSPRTPALGCGITHALSKEYLPPGFGTDYMTSRINWVVQSSGVDYLHLLIVSMAHLIDKYKINARYLISVHDELRYLVADEDKYRAALALQIANLWTRCLFAYRLGMGDLPQGVGFFSSVDVDKVLRKEVDMPCVTPSQPHPIPPGESLNIQALIEKMDGASLWKDGRPMTVDSDAPPADLLDGYQEPDCLVHRASSAAWLRAQATTELSEIKLLSRAHKQLSTGGQPAAKGNTRRRKKKAVADDANVDWSNVVEEAIGAQTPS